MIKIMVDSGRPNEGNQNIQYISLGFIYQD